MSGHRVRFEPVGRDIVALAGDTILDAAARAGLNLAADCGGRGVCAACRVKVDGAAPAGPSSRRLAPELLARGDRLACCTPITADLVVHLPARFQPASGDGRFAALDPLAEVLPLALPAQGPLPGRAALAAALVGPAAAEAVELSDEQIESLDRARRGRGHVRVFMTRQATRRTVVGLEPGAAPQRLFGVTARRIATGTAADLVDLRTGRVIVGVGYERADLAEAVGRLVEDHGFTASQVLAVAVAAGTLGAADRPARAAEAGLTAHPLAPLFVLEASRSGLPASLLAGAVAAGLGSGGAAGDARVRLYVDFGHEGGWLAESPAGCFGAVAPDLLVPGASPVLVAPGRGAVQSVELVDDGALARVELTRRGTVRGLTGAGLVDCVAALEDRDDLRPFAVPAEGGGEVRLTAQDIAAFERGRGAHVAARAAVLDAAGVGDGDVEEVIVAGGLGDRIRPSSFVRSGLVPASERTTLRYLVEDAALQGLRLALVSDRARDAAERLIGHAARVRVKGDTP